MSSRSLGDADPRGDDGSPRTTRARAGRGPRRASPPAAARSTPGHQLDLEHRLVHEQVEPGDQRPPGRRGRGPAASARGRRATSKTTPAAAASREQRRRSAPRPGSSRPARRRPRPRRLGSSADLDRRRRAGARADRGDRLGGPGRVADQQRDARGSPRSASASSDRRRGGAAAEHHRPVDRAVVPLPERRRRAGDVGVVARAGGRPSSTRVLAAPARRPGRSRSSSSGTHRALERHRQRQPAPATSSSPSRNAAQPGRVDLVRVVVPVQPERGVRRPVQHRRQRVRDRAAEHRAARGAPAQQGRDWCRQYCVNSRLVLQEARRSRR